MILETILDFIKSATLFMMDLLPDLNISLPSGFTSWFTEIMSASAYFLPLVDFLIMFGIWLTVTNFEIIWKLIQRLWDALPFT